jgi:transposase
MQTYSRDLRERIIAAREKGHTTAEVIRLFGVSKSSVERYWSQYRRTGKLEPSQRGGYRRSCLEGHDRSLRAWIGEKKDLTLAELRERILHDLGITVGNTALWHRLERLGLSYKKNAARRRAKTGRTSRPPAKAGGSVREAGRQKDWSFSMRPGSTPR